MFKKILIGLVVVIVAFIVIVALQPSEFSVSRPAVMAAPPAEVFAQINDFHNWQQWSPWAKLDPNAKYSFEGPESGVGAKFHWTGNAEVGSGDMTITESRPNELVKLDLHFITPMEDRCLTEFTIKPDGENSAVTWTMSGHSNFVGKAICLFMNMDKMVGGDFEQGLANMKKIVETAPKE